MVEKMVWSDKMGWGVVCFGVEWEVIKEVDEVGEGSDGDGE